MRKMMTIAAISLCLFACNQKTANETSTPAPEAKPVILKSSLASSKCLPCGDMELTEGEIADTMTVDGKVYGFCSPECKESFAANPSQFLTQQ